MQEQVRQQNQTGHVYVRITIDTGAYTSTGPVWKLRIDQVNNMHCDFFVWCLLR